jgi:hypothetical protein
MIMRALQRLLGKNWKSYTGGGVILVAALLQAKGILTPEYAQMATHAGEGLLGVGLAHKLERAISVLCSTEKTNGSNNGN